jgi:preprotein translocase subunit SecG
LFTIVVVFHVLVSFALILVVLMQSSKGEGLAGSAFGGGGISGAVFGGRGAASFLSKATTVLAILFMLNSGALALMSSGTRSTDQGGAVPTESVVTEQAQREREQAIQQQQQQQQQQPPDQTASDSISIDQIQVTPTPATDTGGN